MASESPVIKLPCGKILKKVSLMIICEEKAEYTVNYEEKERRD